MGLKLSKRMENIISMCDTCETIIDIGTDHGKVPIAIANLGLAKEVIATDINEEPLKYCKENAKKYLIDNGVIFKTVVSDGLEFLEHDKYCAIIISGMGYDLISKIIANIKNYNFKYLIISPHTKITEFIKFIDNEGLKIVEEKTVYEDDKAYFIFKIIK